MSATAKVINCIILLLGILMIAYYLALGFAVRFGQSLQFLWLAVGLLCIARFGFWTIADRLGKYPSALLCRVVRIPVLLLMAFYLIVEGAILYAGMAPAAENADCIIVLGARVDGRIPSGALRNRIQTAAEYLAAHPDAIAILSGGRGSDEDISEAACMLECMIAKGVDPARLIVEDQSTNTCENLLFSREKIPAGMRIGLVTNNFHILRALSLARKIGIDAQPIPVATSWISFPHYMMREFIGLMHDGLLGNLKF